jgi:hypothetical protein
MGWYEWRIINKDARIVNDTNFGYGSSEAALRDALIFVLHADRTKARSVQVSRDEFKQALLERLSEY